MGSDASWPTLGRVLVERGVITEEHLEQALAVQRKRGGLLGEILTSRGWVTSLSIAAALARQREALAAGTGRRGKEEQERREGWKPLGTILVEKGYVTEIELKQALAIQRDRGGFVGEILVERGWLAASDLVSALAAQLGLDFEVSRGGRGGSILPSDRPDPHFEVLEARDDAVVLLKKAATFMEATDFVFDEVLWQREPGKLEIVRVDGDRREVVWNFAPGEAAPGEGRDLLSIFGYPVAQWQGSPTYDEDHPANVGPRLAAAG